MNLMYVRYTLEGNILIRNIGMQLKGKTINLENTTYRALRDIEKQEGDKEIYLMGEAHGNSMSYELMEYFTKFFVERLSVKYILLEMGYSGAELLNGYLETGSDGDLYEIIKSFEDTYAGNRSNYNYFKKIYEFNKALPDSEKIHFVGIDIEHQRKLSVKYLKQLLFKFKQEVYEPYKPFSRNEMSDYLVVIMDSPATTKLE